LDDRLAFSGFRILTPGLPVYCAGIAKSGRSFAIAGGSKGLYLSENPFL
jgi:hypothetical protein